MTYEDRDPADYSGELPDIDKVELAYDELQDFNFEHTQLRGALGHILGVMIDDPDMPEVTHAPDSEFSLELTAFNVDPVLGGIGVSRYDPNKIMQVGSYKTARIPGKQGIYVETPILFERFIEANRYDLKSYPHACDMIREIYNNLLNDIETLTAYNKKNSDYAMGVLDMLVDDLAEINDILRDVELDGKPLNFELGVAYANWGKRPEFDDFLEMRRLGLKGEGYYGARDWQVDSSKSGYADRWNDLLDFCQDVCQKYGSKNELRTLCRETLKDVFADVDKWFATTKDESERIKELKEIFENTKQRIEKLHL